MAQPHHPGLGTPGWLKVDCALERFGSWGPSQLCCHLTAAHHRLPLPNRPCSMAPASTGNALCEDGLTTFPRTRLRPGPPLLSANDSPMPVENHPDPTHAPRLAVLGQFLTPRKHGKCVDRTVAAGASSRTWYQRPGRSNHLDGHSC